LENPDYRRIELAIRFLEEHTGDQPSLDDVARYIGLSPFHCQRLFKRWAGVSPKRFLQYLTAGYAKKLLRNSASVLDTAYEVGLSGPGRLHDLFVSVEAVTPGEYKTHGNELVLRYAFHMTPFGECLVAETGRGICSLDFIDQKDRLDALNKLRANWQAAMIIKDDNAGKSAIDQIYFHDGACQRDGVKILLRGTNFQLKVWEALLRIPEGAIVTYGSLASAIGSPGSHRAIGNAVSHNPIAYLIPCHRVIRSTGDTGGYKWGTPRKKAILAMEASHCGSL
jgi:AraC family transcriptional regulator of adaptative response/methylated-DNA-[protein]-cysteine methyltransferase